MSQATPLPLAELLERIPGRDESAMTMTSLCAASGLDPAAGPAITALLGTFGAVTVHSDSTGETLVKANTSASAYFLDSLAQYIRTGDQILGNWERLGTSEAPYYENEVLAGPQFLYLMERQRLTRQTDPPPLRAVEVAQVVIKARVRGRGAAVYLTQYDSAARQFQLLGGYRRHSDASLRETATRELEEELDQFSFDASRDRLVELGQVQVVQLSRTYGVSTRYDMTLFHLRSDRADLSPMPGARWMTEQNLLRDDNPAFSFAGLRALAGTMPVAIPELALSLSASQRRSFWEICREKPWESSGLAVGVLGLVLSVFFYFLS